jgi:hypothetical protein
MAEARLGQQHERALLDPAAKVTSLGVAHDLARVGKANGSWPVSTPEPTFVS